MKISAANFTTLDLNCSFAPVNATRNFYYVILGKATKNLESIKEEICQLPRLKNKSQVVEMVDEKTITPLTTTKRASAAKSLKFTAEYGTLQIGKLSSSLINVTVKF